MTPREWQKLWDAAVRYAYWVTLDGNVLPPGDVFQPLHCAGYDCDKPHGLTGNFGLYEWRLFRAQMVIDFALSKRPPATLKHLMKTAAVGFGVANAHSAANASIVLTPPPTASEIDAAKELAKGFCIVLKPARRTKEQRKFWAAIDKAAKEVESWPPEKRSGVVFSEYQNFKREVKP